MFKLILVLVMVFLSLTIQVQARKNYLYGYQNQIIKIYNDKLIFKLIYHCKNKNKPKKIRVCANPYNLYIKYIGTDLFDYIKITDLNLITLSNQKIIFNDLHQIAYRDTFFKDTNPYAKIKTFDYSDHLKSINLDHINYRITGSFVIHRNGKDYTEDFDVILKTDFKTKYTWDWWQTIMSI
jgi:hypothetical protein